MIEEDQTPMLDWRERESVWFQDFLDADRHAIIGVHNDYRVADRGIVNILHPLPGVAYGDWTGRGSPVVTLKQVQWSYTVARRGSKKEEGHGSQKPGQTPQRIQGDAGALGESH